MDTELGSWELTARAKVLQQDTLGKLEPWKCGDRWFQKDDMKQIMHGMQGIGFLLHMIGLQDVSVRVEESHGSF